MFEKITPEQAGVSSENILKLLQVFERKNYAMHSVLMAHKGKIFFEQYWDPYNKDSLHRLYSAGKSFVSIAVGFLQDEGKISLDDRIIKYFPEYEPAAEEYLKEQTIRDMLKMSTASVDVHWMELGVKKRIEYYFTRRQNRPAGTTFSYDSTGTYILGVVIEKVTGRNFIDYLREKLFRKIGVSEDICCLKTPEGYLWADSGVRCTARDFLKVAQFAANRGSWNGEQLLSREYMEEATTGQVFNADEGYHNVKSYGYGYQFWMTQDQGFAFRGMADQYAICVPEKDFVFICTADNQFNPASGEIIFDNVFEKIVGNLSDNGIEEDQAAYQRLCCYCKDLKLVSMKGMENAEFEKKISGVPYALFENPMKMDKVTLYFKDDQQGSLVFTDEEGSHELQFGIGKNVFTHFPKAGMSDEVGGETVLGYQHQCAVSAAWVEPRKLFIKVQIIDKYLANLNITIAFREEKIGLRMAEHSEFILDRYNGFAAGRAE